MAANAIKQYRLDGDSSNLALVQAIKESVQGHRMQVIAISQRARVLFL